MSEGSGAGTGFSRGFFGCFGVLAAVILCVALLAMCGSIMGSGSDEPPGPDVSQLRTDNPCELALLEAKDQFAGGADNYPSAAPAPAQATVGFECRWEAGGSRFVLSALQPCETPRDPACVIVTGLKLDGVDVLERAR